MSEPKSSNERWKRIYEAFSGATAPGHHYEAPTGTAPESITAGHEPDRFDARGIIMVPVLIVVVTFLAYLMVTGVFSLIQPGKSVASPTTSPLAVEQSEKPFNTRVETISSTEAKAEFHQPRLESLQVVEDRRPGQSKPDPIFLRSFVATQKNNSYELKPQDLYPKLFVDPKTGERLLDEYKKLPHDHARIPVDVAMKLLIESGALKANAEGKAPVGSAGNAKTSNGGQAIPTPHVETTPAAAPAAAPAKKDH